MPLQRQRLSLHIPGSPPGALPEQSTYTPTSDRRRSLISLTDSLSLGSLKPSRAKLQQYWPGAKSPTTPSTTAHDLSALIMLAGEQMGALADPRRRKPASPSIRPGSRQKDDPKLRQDLEMTLPRSATALSRRSSGSIQRKPLPTHAAPRYDAAPAAVPAPSRAPPPPPIPELSAVNFHSEDTEMAQSPPSPVMPLTPVFPSTVRRRAKTPVYHIGQLEAAQRNRNKVASHNGNMDGINRMSSVSTIARAYRELAVYPEMDMPDVPKIDPSYLLQQGLVELPATNSQESRLLGTSYHNHHRRTPSSASDEGTLLGSEPDTCPSLTHSSSPPAEMSDGEDDSDPPALASLRFQIGLELLTKELSTAFADQSSRRPKDAPAGLQIWVMIEAYERLREQLDASSKPTEETAQARDAIDSWIRALYAIHSNIASEGAADDSEYESDQ